MTLPTSNGGIAAANRKPGPGQEAKSDGRYGLVSLVLSATGGLCDAGSYVSAHSFTGDITGNSIVMAVYLMGGYWADAIVCLVALVAFLGGTAGGTMWPNRPVRSARQRLAAPIAIEMGLIGLGLASMAVAPLHLGRTLFIACLFLA